MIDFQYAIFDLDGTLLDSMKYWRNCTADYLKEAYGLDFTDEVRSALMQMNITSAAEYLSELMERRFDGEKMLKGVLENLLLRYKNDVVAKPGAVEYLKKLKQRGVKLCVASATERYMIEEGMKTAGIAAYFDFILTTHDVGKSKLSPLLFDTCLTKFGSNKENTAVFEDALYSIETAKQNGFYVIAIEDSFEAQNADKIKELADEYYGSFLELH